MQYIDQNGRIQIRPRSALRVDIIPATAKMLPVKDRGILYEVPTHDLDGVDLSGNPITAAKGALKFYETKLHELEESFSE